MRILPVATLIVLASATCMASDLAESRYQPAKAKKLTPEQAKLFGPGAEKYRYDARMIRAAELAAQRARKR
jgi:hypothetical protein